ncbi:hypothetical protein N9A42_00375 [bacterium]|nr:hypothetical protein [bacterium]
MKRFQQIREMKIIAPKINVGSDNVTTIEVAFYRGQGWHVQPRNEKGYEVKVDGHETDNYSRTKSSAMSDAKNLKNKFPKAKIKTVR